MTTGTTTAAGPARLARSAAGWVVCAAGLVAAGAVSWSLAGPPAPRVDVVPPPCPRVGPAAAGRAPRLTADAAQLLPVGPVAVRLCPRAAGAPDRVLDPPTTSRLAAVIRTGAASPACAASGQHVVLVFRYDLHRKVTLELAGCALTDGRSRLTGRADVDAWVARALAG